MVWLKKGNEFLINISRRELKCLYKHEKKAKSKLRLLAAIHRKDGKTLDEIAYALDKPKTTIHDWLVRLENSGLKKLHDTKQPGKPSRLTKSQLSRLDKVLESSPQEQHIPFVIWTTKLVQYAIIKLFGVKYELWNVRRIINTLNFGLKSPRPENRKASKKAQERFKENLKKKYGIILNLDSRSSVLMRRTSL